MPTETIEVLEQTYVIDPAHSSAAFAVAHNGHALFRCWFTNIEGELSDGVLRGTVDVSSIAIGMEKFREHVLASEFFNAESAPKLRFESTRLELSGQDLEVHGSLTIREVTKPVVARGRATTAIDAFGQERLALSLGAVVDRRDFGMTWQMPLPGGGDALGHDVDITVELALTRQS